MSAASSSNSPAAGRGACHNSTGSTSGKPNSRTHHGSRATNKIPPNMPIAPIHKAGVATETVANGHCASHCSSTIKAASAQAATSHAGATSTPSMAKGVTSSVTQGMATMLANSPTTDTWPKNSRAKGASATVTTHCSRTMARSRAPKARRTPTARVLA